MVKKLRDVNAPKKPMTAYFRWMKKNRGRVVQSMPIGYSAKQLSKRMSQMWAALSVEAKVKWSEKYKKEMKVYEKLMAAYKHTSNYKRFQKQKQEHTISKTGKFRKDPNRPKKPSTGYFLFMADKREETKKNFPKLDHKQLISKLGELWSKLPNKIKEPYVKKAEEDKIQWQNDLIEYEKTDEFKKYMEEKRIFLVSKKETKKVKKENMKKTKVPKTNKADKKKSKKSNKLQKSKPKVSKKDKSLKSRKQSSLAKKAKKSTKVKSKSQKPRSKVKAAKAKKSSKKSKSKN